MIKNVKYLFIEKSQQVDYDSAKCVIEKNYSYH